MGGGPVGPPLWFFALYSKTLMASQTWKFLTFPNFLLRMPLRINKFQKICCIPVQSTFGTPSTKKKKIFALIKKISLGPPYKQNEEKLKFHIWSVGYQNRVKRVCGVHFWRNFRKIIKGILRSNLYAFSGLAPSKLKIFQQKLRVGYVYIEESFDTIFNMRRENLPYF